MDPSKRGPSGPEHIIRVRMIGRVFATESRVSAILFYTPKHCIYGPRPREAVLLSDWEWYRINDNLYKNNREKEIAQMYSTKEQNKKEFSFNMTKNWQNTLASIKTQSEQRRFEKRKKEKQDKIDEYNKILENRKKERIPILANAKRMLFETKDATRTLTSAMVQCSVLAEREKQIEFKNFLRDEQEKKNALYVENMKKDVENFENEKQKEHFKKLEIKKEIRNDLLKQAEEKKRRTEEMESKERRAAEEDLIKMRERLKKLDECQRQEKLTTLKNTRMNYEKGYHEMELEKSRAIEEDEEYEVNRMIQKYAKRFEKERVQKEGSMIKEIITNRERIAERLSKNLNSGQNKEQKIYEKAVKEMEEENQKIEKEKVESRKNWEAEMKKWEEENKARAAAESRAREESIKWAMLQSERKREIDGAWEAGRKSKVKETKVIARDYFAKQVKEKEELAEKGVERETAFISKRDEEMEDVFKYCKEALEYVKKHEWKDYPLLAAVARVQKDYGPTPDIQSTKTEYKSTKPKGQENKFTESENKKIRPLRSWGNDCYYFRR